MNDEGSNERARMLYSFSCGIAGLLEANSRRMYEFSEAILEAATQIMPINEQCMIAQQEACIASGQAEFAAARLSREAADVINRAKGTIVIPSPGAFVRHYKTREACVVKDQHGMIMLDPHSNQGMRPAPGGLDWINWDTISKAVSDGTRDSIKKALAEDNIFITAEIPE